MATNSNPDIRTRQSDSFVYVSSYCKGAFRQEADGDKSVAYSFPNPYTGVIFEKKLMPLLDAIGTYMRTYLHASFVIIFLVFKNDL